MEKYHEIIKEIKSIKEEKYGTWRQPIKNETKAMDMDKIIRMLDQADEESRILKNQI